MNNRVVHKEGGLGLKQLVLLNRSFLLKKAWEVFSSNSVSCCFLRNRFFRNSKLRRSYATSSIWAGIKRFWPQVIETGHWIIGSGSQVSFWRDNFLGKPLSDFFGIHGNTEDHLSGTVADFINNGS